jgi:hypothetical protein
MMKLIVLAIAISTLIQSLSAQEERFSGKLFYTELGGPGVLMSANFDSRFKSGERLGFGYRIGAGFGVGDFKVLRINPNPQWGNLYYFDDVRRTYYSFPAGLNYIFGTPNDANTFEVGAGVTFLTHKVSLYNNNDDEPGRMIGFITFMYCLKPVNGGFSFRIGFTPIIGTSGELFPIMGAIGIGYAF